MNNKQELTAKIVAARQQLDSVLVRIDEERMPLVVLHGEWSVKDLIGHLGFWENSVVTLFNTLHAGKTPLPSPELNALNAQVLSDSRKQSLTEVRRQEKTAYQKVLSVVHDATGAEMFDSAHFPWTEGRPFESFILDNTIEHYAEHLPEVIAWLKRIA